MSLTAREQDAVGAILCLSTSVRVLGGYGGLIHHRGQGTGGDGITDAEVWYHMERMMDAAKM